ncbi:MAG: 23S rRNA (guanosine(2251)-2'-O)-methyltransferase RlmB [Candidatus Omnitrophota bacterium]
MKNSMLLYGRNSVFERLKANPSSIKGIYLQDNFNMQAIEQLIKANSIKAERLSANKLSNLKPAKDLQGIVARIDPFKCIPFNDLLNQAQDKQLTLIFLDRINDPHNLGVIIRTVACFGMMALIIPEFNACGVNETVLHVASGGENYVSISAISNIPTAIIKAKKQGYWITGAVVDDDAEDLNKISFTFPLGLVFGSEGEGIRYGVQKHLDLKARIPMEGAKLSFNVNMACGIFCYEICKQRGLSI